MKIFAIAILAVCIMGCASDPAKRAAVAVQEVSRLAPPVKALSTFRDYELRPLTMSTGIMADDAKKAVARQLQAKLNARIMPLLERWRADKAKASDGSVLFIEPKVQQLRVISGGARFWLGGLMGESFIDLDLKLTDSATGQVVANPRVRRSASAMGGAFSIGATDRNLLDYITDIAHRYLEVHHTSQSTDHK